MNSHIQSLLFRRLLMPFSIFICTTFLCNQAHAQEKPPKPIEVTVSTAQNLSFGTFIQNGSSGTVTVMPLGGRSATGSVILPGMFSIVTPALFIVTAIPGTLITISNGANSKVYNGGFYMDLLVGGSSTGSPFVVSADQTSVYIGGTLTVGPLSSNPAGAYTGTFDVTFIQQ